MAGLAGGGEPAEIVPRIAHVRLAGGRILCHQPREIVIAIADHLPVAQPALRDVGAGIVGELLEIRGGSRQRALRRHRIAGLEQTVVAVIIISGRNRASQLGIVSPELP